MKDGIVCSYEHDSSVQLQKQAIYEPNVSFLNQCIDKWADDGIQFCGIVHSHPDGQDTLSSGDIEYIDNLYKANPELKKTFFPLVLNGCDIIVYAVERNGNKVLVTADSLELTD